MNNENIKEENVKTEELVDNVNESSEEIQASEERECSEECNCEELQEENAMSESLKKITVTKPAVKLPFFKSLVCTVIDQAAIASCALVLFLAFNYLVLRLMGYEIKPEFLWTILLITYVISSVLYPVIMETTVGNTVGRQLTNLKVDNLE